MTVRTRFVIAPLAVALFASALPSSALFAQAGLGQIEDAATPPRGFLRLRPIIAWTRYDSRFSATGVEPLGASFTAESLGVGAYPALFGIELLTRQVSQANPAFRINLGRSRLDATAREEILPLAFDYGVTRRFAVSFVVPIVRRRLSTLFRLDSTGANVGPNLNRTFASATQTNQLVQSEFASAATQLQARLSSCQADPSGPGCAAVIAQAPALIAESQTFASQVASLYGSASQSGAAFVPRASSAEQSAVAFRVSDFNARYSALLGANTIQAIPVGAAGPPGVAEFQSFVVDDAQGDSLNTQERFGIGDIELGFKFRVIDRPVTQLRHFGVQLAVAAAARLPTGSREAASEVVNMRLGEGDPVADVRGVLDTRFHRIGLLSVVHFSARTAKQAVPVTTTTSLDQSWFEVHAAPRWHLSEAFAVHGAYSYRKTDLSGDQLVGGGVSFMSLGTRPNGAPPMEMRFTHLEALNGDPGRPKFFREQLEVRMYFRVLR